MPKAGAVEDNDVLPPVTQPLPAQPPEGAGALVEQQAANEAAAQQAVRQTAQQPTQVAPPPVETRPQPVPQPKSKPVETKPAEVKPKPAPQPKPVEVKPAPKPEPKPEPTPKPEPAPQPKPAEEKAPAGQAYVVQLGALKNAAKANEIVASLRLSGYRAFTVPSTPVQGQITRIYVGPDASKQKLQAALPSLNSISGLSGQVKPYGR